MRRRLAKQALPPVWVDEDEHATLDSLATREGMTVSALVLEFVRQGVELLGDGTAKVVVLEIPQCTYDAFEKWTKGGGEEGIDAMARFLAHQGECIEEMMAANEK